MKYKRRTKVSPNAIVLLQYLLLQYLLLQYLLLQHLLAHKN